MAPKKNPPGQGGSGKTLSTRKAIGVSGNQYIDPATGQVVGYQGYTADVRGEAHPRRPRPGGIGSSWRNYLPATVQTRTPTAPRYFEGDQLDPVNWPTAQQIDLQNRMFEAGLYEKGQVPRRGVWDDIDFAAYERLLTRSNMTGQDKDEELNRLKLKPLEPAGKPREPFRAELTSEETLTNLAHEVATQVYGGPLPDDMKQRFVSSFRQAELEQQQTEYNTEETGGMIDQPLTVADAQERLRQQIWQEAPSQAAGTYLGSLRNNIISVLSRQGGGEAG